MTNNSPTFSSDPTPGTWIVSPLGDVYFETNVALKDGDKVKIWLSSDSVLQQRYYSDDNLFGPVIKVNTLPIYNTNFPPSATVLEDGSFIIVWGTSAYDNQNGYYTSIHQQHYNSKSEAIGSETIIKNLTSGNPDIVALKTQDSSKDAGYIMAWEGFNNSIALQHYNSKSEPVGSEIVINKAINPVIAALKDGSYVLVWQSNGKNGWDGVDGIYKQHYDSNNNPIGPEVEISNNNVINPDITVLKDGSYVIVWEVNKWVGGDYQRSVHMIHYGSDDKIKSPETIVNIDAMDDFAAPNVIALEDGSFIVDWKSGEKNISYQKHYDSSDHLIGNMTVNQNLSVSENVKSNQMIIGATDADGDVLSYSIKNGFSPMKGTVTFGEENGIQNGTYIYTPNADKSGIDSFIIVANDGHGGTAELTVNVTITPTYNAPVVANQIPDQLLNNINFNYVIPADSFKDIDGDNLTYNVLIKNNDGTTSALPSWLHFDSTTGTLYGTSQNETALSLVVTAFDGWFSTSQNFKITLKENVINGTNNDDELNGTIKNDIINGFKGNDIINGNDGNDLINGGEGNDTMNGNNGSDLINGGDGDDVINGNQGNDTINGDNGNDIINGGLGVDVLNGGNGNDIIIGASGNDIIDGGLGDDVINGGKGNDILNGGKGNDTYFYNVGDGKDIIDENSLKVFDDNSSNNDVIEFGPKINLENIVFNAPLSNSNSDLLISFVGYDGCENDQITIKNFFARNYSNKIENIKFSNGVEINLADYLSKYHFVINSDNNSAFIITPYGSEAENLNYIINTHDGADHIVTENGNDIINSGSGDDIITSHGGNDIIDAGLGNDTIDAQDGNDVLIGGGGDDTLSGGNGDDIYIHNKGDGADIIVDGGNGNDIIKLGAGIKLNDLNISSEHNDLKIISKDNPADSITIWWQSYSYEDQIEKIVFDDNSWLDISNKDNFTYHITGDDSSNNITGSSYNDVISGLKGRDIISGGKGNDVINGNEGNDTINGDDGNDILNGDLGTDVLNGGKGDDTIFGGLGADILTGDLGSDMFVYNNIAESNNAKYDTITDFSHEEGDKVIINGISEADLTVDYSGNDTFVHAGDMKIQFLGHINFVEGDIITHL